MVLFIFVLRLGLQMDLPHRIGCPVFSSRKVFSPEHYKSMPENTIYQSTSSLLNFEYSKIIVIKKNITMRLND